MVSLLFGSASVATKAEPTQERHRFPISIANPAPSDALRDGPLFRRVDQLSYADSKSALADALAADATANIKRQSSTATKLVDRRSVETFIAIVLKDCQGPYAIDEGSVWVQTSWVCHVGVDRGVREYFDFAESPEISIEFKFEGTSIKSIYAMEVMPTPLNPRYLPMDAAETIPDKR
jgi:hypothetical protein